jgi:hypothetical protein
MENQRTVSRSRGGTYDAGMSLVGVAVALGLLPVVLPLAPALAALWLLQRLRSDDRPRS